MTTGKAANIPAQKYLDIAEVIVSLDLDGKLPR